MFENCCFLSWREERAKQGAFELHLVGCEGEGSGSQGFPITREIVLWLEVKIRSQRREGEGAESRSRPHFPSELTSEAKAGRQPRGQPTDPQRARTRRRRPRRPRLSEEVCPLIAELRSPSHRLPGAGSGRRREWQSLPPGEWAGQPRAQHPPAPSVAMGGSASSQLDEGKCAYIRGTPAGASRERGAGPPRALGQAGRPGTGPTGRDPRGARRLPPPSPALHGPLSSGGRGPGRGARRLLSQRSSSWRAARHEPWPGWGALQPGERAGDALGSAAGRLGETGAGYGVGDHPGSSTRPASMSLLHPTPAQQHLPILSVPVPGLSSEPFLNLPQKEQWGISLASRDFPGDSRPMKQNFPPGTVGLVL